MRVRLRPSIVVVAIAAATVFVSAQQNGAYTLVSRDGRQTVPVRTSGGTDFLTLDQLASLFGVSAREDRLVGGLTITAGSVSIALTPNQNFASVGGRIVSLSAPIRRDGSAWLVPLDFLPRALGPALGERIVVRPDSRLILVGDVRVPEITVRFERQAGGGRLVCDVVPATAFTVTRDAARVLAHFDAPQLDLDPLPALPADLVSRLSVSGATLEIDLGAGAASVQSTADTAGGHLTITLATSGQAPAAPPTAPAATPAPPGPPAAAPAAPLPVSSGVMTVVLDPGHGGADEGTKSAGGLTEKALTLSLATQLKAAIESRLGLRVLLTRDADRDVPVDERTAFANNNKADLFISLHANASFRAEPHGAEVLILNLQDYQDRLGPGFDASGIALPLAGGGSRTVAAVPWDLAQIPHVPESRTLAGIVVQRLHERGVPLHDPAEVEAPLRVLAGANMPALLVEVGFLSNPDDAAALAGAEPAAIVNALVDAITDVRAGIPRGGVQ